MKVLAIIPDPGSAYGLGAALAALPPGSTRVVAFGQATAAVLPAGLDIFVYPLRDGTRMPAPFLDALVAHEQADVLLAPTGAIASTPIPALLVDLDPRVVPPAVTGAEDPAGWTWIEGITAIPDRRPTLLKAGLFSVDVLADWYEGPGRLAGAAGPSLFARMAELAGLLGRHRPSPGGPSVPLKKPSEGSHKGFIGDRGVLTEVETTSGPSIGRVPEAGGLASAAAPRAAPPEPRVIPIEFRSTATALMPPEAPTAPVAPPPAPQPVAPLVVPPPPEAAALPGAGPLPAVSHSPELFRGRHAGSRCVVVVSPRGIEQLAPEELGEGVVIAVPGALAWLTARRGTAHFTCVATPPESPEATGALRGMRSIVVHDAAIDAAECAPRARATVPLLNLERAGGPALGWSDDMKVGFFPAPGDLALALQWAHWLGASEVVLAGVDPGPAKSAAAAFLRGARELLEGRGVKLTLLAADGA